jgi:predicted TPR repeat methyltransferase
MSIDRHEHLVTAARHHQAGELYEAMALYDRLLEHDPASADVLQLAGIAASQSGDLAAAARHLRRAAEILPDEGSLLGALGQVLREQGQLDEAVECYRRGLALDPGQAGAHHELGRLLEELGRLDEATACHAQAVALDPELAAAHDDLGRLLERSDPDRAEACFHEALRASPELAVTHHNLGILLWSRGKLAEAESSLRRAIELGFASIEAHRSRGHVLRRLGRLQDAADELREVLRQAPDDEQVRFELAVLGSGETPSHPPQDYILRLFDDYSERFDHHLLETLGYRGPQLLREAFDAAASHTEALDVLDLGCGTGLCGALFRDVARRLKGVDLSPRMIDRARERGVYDELMVGEISEALLAPGTACDLVLAGDVLIYLGDPAPVLLQTAGALRPGGLFTFTVEEQAEPGYSLQPTGRYSHSRECIERLAGEAGLSVRHCTRGVLRRQQDQPVVGLIFVLGRDAHGA